eukprot:555071-Pleurochrysis_carterae.AAC.2
MSRGFAARAAIDSRHWTPPRVAILSRSQARQPGAKAIQRAIPAIWRRGAGRRQRAPQRGMATRAAALSLRARCRATRRSRRRARARGSRRERRTRWARSAAAHAPAPRANRAWDRTSRKR